MMKTFDLPTDDSNELVESQLIEMPAENFAIATNNVDKIAYGGADKKVITRQVVLQQTDAGRNIVKLEGDPYIGLLFNSAVK